MTTYDLTAGQNENDTQKEHLFECLELLLSIADEIDNPDLYQLAHEIKATTEILLLPDE